MILHMNIFLKNYINKFILNIINGVHNLYLIYLTNILGENFLKSPGQSILSLVKLPPGAGSEIPDKLRISGIHN